MCKLTCSRLIIILICISEAILPLYASSPQIVCRPLQQMLEEIPAKHKEELNTRKEHYKSLLTTEKMDSLMSLQPDSVEILSFSPEQAEIFRFFETGCGFYVLPSIFSGGYCIPVCERFYKMYYSDFKTFQNWYWIVKPHISKPFIDYYCYLLAVHEISDIRNEDNFKDNLLSDIHNLRLSLSLSLHLIYYWYLYEGDNDSIPPVGIIEYGLKKSVHQPHFVL